MKKLPIDRILPLVIAAFLVFVGYGWYQYSSLQNENRVLETRVLELEEALGITESSLTKTEEEKENLSEELIAEKERVGDLADQVEDIAGTVGVLDKLSKTDEELLQKYSKIYFLNEHYIPPRLKTIPLTHLYNESVSQQIHADVWPYLEDLIEDAADDGVTLWINSAYRSFGTQASLKAGYTVVYGSGANTFSADQGYSEHQLGTTVDFTTEGIGGGYSGFEKTPAYNWLLQNAHKYGFVLSYPEGNAYYVFEPWHWRFVGVDLANDLEDGGESFYDKDQRQINEYLVNIFD